MEIVQRTWQQIRERLGSLPANTQLLIGSFMVILVMTLVLVSQYAGRSSMAPLPIPMDREVTVATMNFLQMRNIPAQERNGRIYVAADQQYTVLAQLNEQDIVAGDQIDFNALIELQSNPFVGQQQQKMMLLVAKQNVLGRMISSRNDVAQAVVIIDEPPGIPGLGRANVAPTAAVNVRMRSGQMTQEVADAIGRLVAGAQAGLKLENVTVNDSGSSLSFRPRGPESLAGGAYLEHKQKMEQHFRTTIEDALRYVPGAIVTVNAIVDHRRAQTQRERVDDPKSATLEERNRTMQSTGAASSMESAVRTNVGVTLPAAGRGSQTSESMTEERLAAFVGGSRSVQDDPGGYPLQINASIGIPRSFFVRLYRAEVDDAEAVPDAETLDALVRTYTGEIEQALLPLIRTEGFEGATPGTVFVRMVHDFDGLVQTAALGGTLVGSGGVGEMIANNTGLVRNLLLGALAVFSFVMMFLMVRRATAREPLPTAEELVGLPPALDPGDDDLIGEVDQAEVALEGVELDGSTYRTQQLLNQINDMIKNGPEEASSLMQRWLAVDD